jgi:hypothetical protein
MLNLLRPNLGDLPILAELAVNVAAGRGNGKGVCPGQEVEERLFFDGVDVHRAGFAVDKAIIGTTTILPDAAVAPFLISEFAEAGTEKAFNFSVRMFFIITRFDPGEV